METCAAVSFVEGVDTRRRVLDSCANTWRTLVCEPASAPASQAGQPDALLRGPRPKRTAIGLNEIEQSVRERDVGLPEPVMNGDGGPML